MTFPVEMSVFSEGVIMTGERQGLVLGKIADDLQEPLFEDHAAIPFFRA